MKRKKREEEKKLKGEPNKTGEYLDPEVEEAFQIASEQKMK